MPDRPHGEGGREHNPEVFLVLPHNLIMIERNEGLPMPSRCLDRHADAADDAAAVAAPAELICER